MIKENVDTFMLNQSDRNYNTLQDLKTHSILHNIG